MGYRSIDLKRIPRSYQWHTSGGQKVEQAIQDTFAFRPFVGICLGRDSASAVIGPPHTVSTEPHSKQNRVPVWSLRVC